MTAQEVLTPAALQVQQVTPYRHERPLFVILAILSLLSWVGIIAGTFGVALGYLLGAFIMYLFAQSGLIAYLKGTAVRIDGQQFPDLDQRIRRCSQQLGMDVPEAYLLHADGLFNAFATRFLGRNFIVLYSDVVDALADRPDAIDFYIGHELGHLHRKHLQWAPVLWWGKMLPILGPAYARACEYTCDGYGRAVCSNEDDAARAIAAIAAGGDRWRTLELSQYARQAQQSGGFWMSFHELVATYPWLTKRMWRVLPGDAQPPRRNPFAYLFALFVPNLGAGGAGFLVMVAMIGILAAVAIPQYKQYQEKAAAAALMGGLGTSEPAGADAGHPAVGGASNPFQNVVIASYAESAQESMATYLNSHNHQLPATLGEAGIDPSTMTEAFSEVSMGDNGTLTLTLNDGGAIALTPQLDNGELSWSCQHDDSVDPEMLPSGCQ